MVRVSAGIAVGHHERRHVLHHLRAAADHRHLADAAELMHRRQPAHHGMVLHLHVAGQRGDVGHDDAIAERAIVRHVAVGQDGVVRADEGGLAVAGGAVDGDVFAERVVVADFRAGDAALPFQVLGLESEAGERKNLIVLSEFGVAINDHVRMQPAMVSQRDVCADDAIRPDFAIGADLRLGMNEGRRMECIHDLRFTISRTARKCPRLIRRDMSRLGKRRHVAALQNETIERH